MAKSARASAVKKNHRNLRTKVFGPAHDARTARLSAKLQELVAKPTPDQEKKMDVDDVDDEVASDPTARATAIDEEMGGIEGAKVKPSKKVIKEKAAARKEHKVSKRKPRNQMTFASERARSRKAAAAKKSKR